jgi:hypothetical protein
MGIPYPSVRETHTYAFIHTDDIKTRINEFFGGNMQFDVIIGNPPYQITGGDGRNKQQRTWELTMSLATPSCVQKLQTASHASLLNPEGVCLFREPDAGNLPVRFDEREQENRTKPNLTEVARRKPRRISTGRLQSLAPVLDSTRDYAQNDPRKRFSGAIRLQVWRKALHRPTSQPAARYHAALTALRSR